MRWWGRKDSDHDEDGGDAARSHRRRDPLVEAVVQRFSPEAAAVLARRKWQPKEVDERIGWAIVTGVYRDLTPYGDASVVALKRSSSQHQWQPAVLEVLKTIGTESALRALGTGVRMRWRRERWDAFCAACLAIPDVRQAMADELIDGFHPDVARMLAAAGWTPATTDESVAAAIAQGDPDRAASFGPAGIPTLQRALEHVSDPYPVLNALAAIGTPESAAAVLSFLIEQWRNNVSRWSDTELVTKCGGSAVRPLFRLMAADPARTSLAVDMLEAVMSIPERVSDADLALVASMPDPRHVYAVPDDPRPHEHAIDCSRLRGIAAEELRRRIGS